MALLQHVCFRMTLGTGDMEDNNGKVAVVAGAAGGLGRGAARLFAPGRVTGLSGGLDGSGFQDGH